MDTEDRTVKERLLNGEGHRFNFFQAVYLLEKLFGLDRIRFRPHPGRKFPATDIHHIQVVEEVQSEGGRERVVKTAEAEVVLSFMGLYGYDSPLPGFISAKAASRTDAGARLRAFLDIFNHRIYDLFYQSWKKNRSYLQARDEGGEKDCLSRCVFSLLGLHPSEDVELGGLSRRWLLANASVLSHRSRSAEGLRWFLSADFGGVDVSIVEFVPRRVVIPKAYRPRLGEGHDGLPARLGKNTTLGKTIVDASGKFRVVIGPLSREVCQRFLPPTFLFSVRSVSMASLDCGNIPSDLRRAFAENDLPLSQNAAHVTVFKKEKDRSWSITDTEKKQTYSIQQADDGFSVYLGGGEYQQLRQLIQFYAPAHLGFDVELLMRRSDVHPLQLGKRVMPLGRLSWIGTPPKETVSIVLPEKPTSTGEERR